MKKSELKRIIKEELKEAVPHQFGSDAAKELAKAEARFSNAVVEVNPKAIWKYYKEMEPYVRAHVYEIQGFDNESRRNRKPLDDMFKESTPDDIDF